MTISISKKINKLEKVTSGTVFMEWVYSDTNDSLVTIMTAARAEHLHWFRAETGEGGRGLQSGV